MKPTMGSLFAGIGGFDLGFERAGFETVWQVEINEWCRKVLAKNFPKAERYADIRECGRHNLSPVDVICGGFPCQDISEAGLRLGIDGERSGLWREMWRITGELRPRILCVENVTAIFVRGIERVLSDLASIGYDAEWDVVGADDLGASQHRERFWLLAYPDDAGFQGPIWAGKPREAWEEWTTSHCEPMRSACGFWPPGPREVVHIPRMDDGPAARVDRLRGLGNAVVPQIPELFAKRIRALLVGAA